MRAKAKTATLARTAPGTWIAGLMAVSGAVLWAEAMLQREALVAAYGPICSVHPLLSLAHCPQCYLGAGLIAGALAILGFTAYARAS